MKSPRIISIIVCSIFLISACNQASRNIASGPALITPLSTIIPRTISLYTPIPTIALQSQPYNPEDWDIYDEETIGFSGEFRDIEFMQDRTILFAVPPVGILKYKNGLWEKIPTPESLADKAPYSITTTENGTIWVVYYSGTIASFDGTNWTTHHSSDWVLRTSLIIPSGNDNVWVVTQDGIYDGLTWSLLFDIPTINSIVRTQNGTYWATTNFQLLRYNGTGWDEIHVETDFVDGGSGSEHPAHIFHLISGSDDSLWFTILSRGFVHYFPCEDEWLFYSYPRLASDIIGFNATALAFTKDGTLWAGRYDSPIIRFDGITWSEIQFPTRYVFFIEQDDNGIVWIGDVGKIYRYHP